MEILWDVDYFQPKESEFTVLNNRPQKRPLTGIPVRRLDHVNLMSSDVTRNKNFMMDELGFRLRACSKK